MSEPERTDERQAETREKGTEVLVALALLLISGYVFVTSFFFPRPGGWQTAPGMLPMLIGGSLAIMSAVILAGAIRRGALHSLLSWRPTAAGNLEGLRRSSIALAVVAIFYFGLLRFLPFEIAAIIFLFAMFRLFWRDGSLVAHIVVAVCVTFILAVAFQAVFKIPVPGEESLVQMFMYWLKNRGAG